MIDFEMAPDSRSPSASPLMHFDEAIPGNIEPFSMDTPEEALPSYLKKLNLKQREAALHTQGPLIVLAGAGSGKTRMLTARIAYLMGHLKVPPHRILAVTFTNKAAGEMKERVGNALEHSFGQAEIGTFHSVCVRILRREVSRLPFTQPFVIYDDSDQLSLIKEVMRRLDLDPKTYHPKSIQGAINRAKCDAVEPKDYEVSDFSPHDRIVKRVFEEYQNQLFASNALDFGEILCLTYRLFRDHEEVRQAYQKKYQYIHVDEYQDTNRVQYLLLSTLAKKNYGGHENICVVGDEDQSIYKWRGADIRNILDFEADYPQAHTVKLEQNYRSTKTIITAASRLISHNEERKEKNLWTENEDGQPIVRYQFPDERGEAEEVISEMKRLLSNDAYSLDDFAIFYRTHAQSRQFEDVLRREKLQYQIIGGLRFYDRKEIKDILSYFKVILNPTDSVSLRRIINVPARGIGKTTINKLDELLATHASEFNGLWDLLVKVTSSSGSFSPRVRAKLGAFVKMMQLFMNLRNQMPLSDLYHRILDETGYVVELKKDGSVEALSRIENLEEFDSLVQEFEEDIFDRIPQDQQESKYPELLGEFVERTTLLSSVDDQFDPQSVKMMSLHGAKGLEFPVVFLVGMEEGLFPSLRPWEDEDPEELQEERRLCYVGMTRARQKLYLSHAAIRRLWGKINYQDPARFFDEIPTSLIQYRDFTHRTQKFGSARKVMQEIPSRDSAPVSSHQQTYLGRRIQHPEFGEGVIIDCEGSGPGTKVTIEFGRKDRRKFLLRFVGSYLI